MGLMLAEPGFHTRCFVEWEEYPRSTIIAAQRAGYFAPAPIWDDLTTFDGRPFRGAIDTILAGYPCFVAGTIVCTKRGHVPIEEVAVGDLVLTHRGRWRPVTARMGKSGAPVRQIKAQGVPGVICTDEHPFYVQGGDWVAAQHIARGDKLGHVLPPVVDDERSVEFWWVLGRYLADGWRQWSPSQRDRRRGRISICCARHEADELERRIGSAGLVAYRSEERTTTRFAITRHDLYEFCGQFGEGAGGKHLPGWVLGLDPDRARALCEGYFTGDGYRYRNPRGEGGGWRVTTVSRGLALSFAALAQRAFGVVASIRRYRSKGRTSIEGRDVSQKDQYFLIVPDRNRSGRVEGDYAWKMVRSNKPCGTADVFNIAVEEDESYVADGAIVHNCQPFSHAGQRKGADDERHLWPDVARIIREVEPEWVFLENVAGHVSLGAETVLRELRDMGWTPAAGLFSAAEVGASHERLRWFCVAYRESVERRGEQPEGSARSGRDAATGTGRAMDNATSARCEDARVGSSADEQGGECVSGTGCGAMADAGGPGLQGREQPGPSDQRNGASAPRPTSERGGFPLFPPGPGDRDAWAAILREDAGAAPALGRGGTVQASKGHIAALDGADAITAEESFPCVMDGRREFSAVERQAAKVLGAEAVAAVRRLIDGLAFRSRALRLLGNGVCSLAAAHAWRTLSAAHGLGCLDLEAAGGEGEADATQHVRG